ncbi:hypothetical protein FHW23_002336 [Curtobacterium pusillum]|uniref:Uncharacterized protein n=1 Tax=Curtobacterium pusillum TaxID=69373 RepID=A0AAW3T7B5_9MICO|nr:hypothetical protein [Curtobacterium pusillum]MBA8991071.1 hypothetical protein [Curtobacterium pusillum]
MSRRLRVLLAAALTIAFVAGGSSAAWALWTATGTTASSVTIGKTGASLSGTSAMTTTFSSTVTSITKPITLTNSGSLAGTATTSVSVVSGSSTTLAQAVTVTAWPVTSATACTDSTAVGTGSVSGTWGSLPSMTSKLAAGASAVWCTRSTPTSSAPASSTTTVHVNLTVTTGTWTSGVVQGAFSLTTPAASPALTCTDHNGTYVELAWDTTSRPKDTWYGAFVGSTMVAAKEQGYYGRITLAPDQVPASAGTSGPVTVTVKVLDSAGNPTSTVAGTGTITLLTQSNGKAVRCGA